MFARIQHILKRKNILHHSNEGIEVCVVKDNNAGLDLALVILRSIVDSQRVLYLSGGKTPKELYERLAASEIDAEEKFAPGAVGMVDERFGPPYHPKSNELMIKKTQLLRYFEMLNVPFYPMLDRPHPSPATPVKQAASLRPALKGEGNDRKRVAAAYDKKIRLLHSVFQKSIAIVGIGVDGHTAGMPAAGNSELRTKNDEPYNTYDLVTEYNDTSGTYGERVTMTFLGLSMMDLLLVLVFGADKKQALELMFKSGSEEEIPARFYKRPEIARKTILITDQSV